MTETRLDVLAIGDAVVDVIAAAEDEFLASERLVKGSMQVLDAEGATRLYAHMRQARETSGGSAANTMAGVAALGRRAGFVGQVADDQLGEIFIHDISALGVEFVTPPKSGGAPTGRCLILVTPDAQRTMNTFRGAAHELSADALDPEQIKGAAILYLGGLSVALGRAPGGDARGGPDRPRGEAPGRAHFVRHRLHRPAPRGFHGADRRREGSTFCSPTRMRSRRLPICPTATRDRSDPGQGAVAGRHLRGGRGARGREGAAGSVPIARIGSGVVDTTGAGDLFAAGVLAGLAEGRSLEDALKMGSIAAAEVISHFGARPEADLKALVEQELGPA